MNEYGFTYFGPVDVPGAHSMETWHQIFPVFVTNYLWNAVMYNGPAGPPAAAALDRAAGIEKVMDLGIQGGVIWFYHPAALHDPAPLMTPVLFVYPNQIIATGTEAQRFLSEKGFIDIAEAEHAVIILNNPVDGRWGSRDITVYNATLLYIFANGDNKKLTFFNLLYAFGEGSGADFINTYFSKNAGRIAGVAAFGGSGTAPGPYGAVPLPAYIAGGSNAVIAYYRGINNTNAQKQVNGKTVYYYDQNDRQQVMVNPAAAAAFDAVAVREAWDYHAALYHPGGVIHPHL
jgi:hypothetical protein